ncbi:Glycosyl hydrolase family 65, N-terminal domain [Amphibacillus marinus]|uniref:Glycosyl hydrolase family 65, N-terminal domain n=1 Tax=Amphibacillus marinus TaxID=872970 RepID=A0A1H8QEB1_9BACI|nr:glycoside hydrolase N-terminal domain-containing protein [Amphibacillus marinus]SEO52579.1 Glycosyl hydrolase family 65, N-terminal domain [Amphibacillus marinus]
MMTTLKLNKPAKGIWHDQPAAKWEEGFVAGNGKQGLIVLGDPCNEVLIGNHAKLFLPMGNQFSVPQVKDHLPELREIINQKGYQAALEFHYQKAEENGYPGLTMSDPYHPAFHLSIKTGINHFTSYRRSLNYQTGEITTQFIGDGQRYQSQCFVSRADDIMVYHIKNADGLLDLMLAPEVYQVDQLDGHLTVNQDGVFQLNYAYTQAHGGYSVTAQVLAPDYAIESLAGAIRVTEVSECTIVLKITPELDQKKFIIKQSSYAYWFARHRDIHQELFDRVRLSLTSDIERGKPFATLLSEAQAQETLSPVFIEKMYDAGRYMYLSCSGDATPNLQGIWSGTFHPAWSGDYTFDTNVQLSIAAALTGDLAEGLKGLFSLIKELLPGFKENAWNYYGCRGIMAAIHSSNRGQHLHWNVEWPLHFWTCGAGWLAHWYYQYYRFTGDLDFLKEEAVPFLEEIALFYQDFLTEDLDGYYRFSPSYSAENGCGDNATQDIAVAKEVLTNLIASYRILGVDTANIELYQKMLTKLPPYQINKDGALKEWLTPEKGENYNHRHFSHLYPIFQSREFTKESEPELFKAAETAFEKRLEAWLLNDDGDTTSTHGRMHTALCATQFHMPELIKEVIMLVIKNNCFFPSLMMSHYNNLEVFNVDGNGAFPQIVHEFLCDYHHDTLYLLQALPTDLSSGQLRGLKLADQLEVRLLTWDLAERKLSINIIAHDHDRELSVKLPLFKEACINDRPVASQTLQLVKNQVNQVEITL